MNFVSLLKKSLLALCCTALLLTVPACKDSGCCKTACKTTTKTKVVKTSGRQERKAKKVRKEKKGKVVKTKKTVTKEPVVVEVEETASEFQEPVDVEIE